MPYVWNTERRKYVSGGREIPPPTVRGWITDTVENAKEGLSRIATDFRTGRINRPEWFIRMREELVRGHSAVAMVAQGGRAQMNTRAWGRIGQAIRSEVDAYLRGFEREIANGREFSDAEFVARARKYANGFYASYQNGVRGRDRDAGVSRVRRVLDTSAENCTDCPGLAGEYDIDDAPAIGDSTACGGSCRCFYEEVA